jgi:hypothetical protein
METTRNGLFQRAAAAGLFGLALACGGGPALLAGDVQTSVRSDCYAVWTKAVVRSIDRGTRHLVVTDSAGDTFPLKAPEVLGAFNNLRVGDSITATYDRSYDVVLAAPNAPLPPDAQMRSAERAASGDIPREAFAHQTTVSGAVIAIDRTYNTLKVVNPRGGEVHTIEVTSPEGRRVLAKLKVGDQLTAYITENLLLSLQPS